MVLRYALLWRYVAEHGRLCRVDSSHATLCKLVWRQYRSQRHFFSNLLGPTGGPSPRPSSFENPSWTGLCLNSLRQSRTYSRPVRAKDGAMKAFIHKYEDRIHGVLSCFDLMLVRGYLPIMSGWQMAQFFNSSGIRFRELKAFLVGHAERVKRHAVEL